MTKAMTAYGAGITDVKKEISKKTLLLLLAGIFILALLLRGLAFMRFKDDMYLQGDARNYYLMSHQLADTGIYGYWYDGNPNGGSPGVSNARVTPGYPLFLTAVYAIIHDPYLHITAVRLIQAILGSLSALLGFIFVKRLFKNDWMGLFTALLIAIYPPYIFSATLLLTEVTGLFTMLLYFCMAIIAFESGKKWHHFLAGVAFGIHVLIRPALLPLFIIPFIYLLLVPRYQRKHPDTPQTLSMRKISGMFLLQLGGFVLVMAPWWIRNVVSLGSLILTAKGDGNALLAGTYPYWQDYFKDIPESIKGVNDAQREWGINRIIKGFTTDFWLYFKWFTFGKIGYTLSTPYLSYLVPDLKLIMGLLHKGILFSSLVGMIWHAVKSIKGLGFYFYGLIILGLQLLFVPDPRYAYLLMFFLMVGSAFFAERLLSWLISWVIKKRKVKAGAA